MSYLRRIVYLVLATFFLVLGILGVLLPGLPATPFFLLTSYFLVRSWPALNARLLRSPLVGAILRDWQNHGGIRWHVKIKATVLIVAALLVTMLTAGLHWALLLAIMGLGAIGIGVVLLLPNVRPEARETPAQASEALSSVPLES